MMSADKIKILIIEDEIPIQRMLAHMVSEIRPEWEIIKITSSVNSTLKFLEEGNKPDLIFSDIQLSDGISFDIFSQYKIECPVIFLTAYNQYAIQAFEVYSLDYILKPISPDALEKAILKFENIFVKESKSLDMEALEIAISRLTQSTKKYRHRFLINQGEDFFTLNTKDIAFIYSLNKISFARTFEDKEYILDYSLENLEQQLDPDSFYRANRKAIVNIDAIVKIRTYFNGKLKVKTNPAFVDDLVVSRDKARHFKQWLNE